MDFIKNYGLFLENKSYAKSNAVILNEAASQPDMQTADGLKKVMSGENGGAYTNQWNQLVDHMAANKKADGTYTVLINHDNKTPMINLEYSVKGQKIDWDSLKLSTKAVSAPELSADFESLKTQALDISQKIVDLFGGPDGSGDMPFFDEFKGWANDDDTAAANAFSKWYDTYLAKKVEAIKNSAQKIADETLKQAAAQNANAIIKAKDSIISKMKGNWDTNDEVRWSIAMGDGTVKAFKLDTDF